jgi:hypothetical protein
LPERDEARTADGDVAQPPQTLGIRKDGVRAANHASDRGDDAIAMGKQPADEAEQDTRHDDAARRRGRDA